jgi:predicted O-methyltransferase YrrM
MGLADAETQTTARERDCLAAHAAGRRRLVEIGVWHGVTTARLRAAMDPAGELSAVDPFPRGRLGINFQERIAHRQIDRIPGGRVRWLKTTGADAASGHGSVDFVFIDGDHSEAGLLADWRAWSALVEPGGIVALHDSRSTPERAIDDAGSVKVTNTVILRDERFEAVDAVDSLTVLRRR